ncbi:MAG: V-type ATPase subunit [Deltaproteobacteria bacterium]|nr:V-type ATPase subunit [Deltaproteobacteria bacterium]
MDLSYFNARVRGLKGGLLDDADYEALLKLDDGRRYLESLKSTPYGPYLETAGARFTRYDDIVAEALRMNLSDTLAHLWKISPPEALPLLKAVVSAWEVYNIKAIVRGIARGVKRDEILGMIVPAGEFDRSAVKDLLSSRDLNDMVRFLDTWGSPYSKPIKAGLEGFTASGRIMDIELNIDRFIYAHLLSTIGGGRLDAELVRDSTVLRIDLQNILTLFKISGEGFTKAGAGDFFIEGGRRLKKKEFLRLAQIKKREELIESLIPAIRDPDIREALVFVDPSEVALLGEKFDEIVEKRLRRLSVTEPLSLALCASFIYAKVREVRNLRILSRSKSFSIPESETRRLLL